MLGSMIFSVFLFFWTLLKKYLNANKYQIAIISCSVLFTFIQLASSPVEAFYWYNGAVHYIFMNSVMLMMLSLALSFLKEVNEKKQTVYLIGISVLGFILGGVNYVTVLTAMLTMAIVLLFVLYYKCIGSGKCCQEI